MSNSQNEEKPQIVSDEDWKERIKAEDAALDEKFKDEAKASAESPEAEAPKPKPSRETSEQPADFPPASFFSLLSMFSTQAMVSLGVIPNPSTGEAETSLPLAKHFIDTIGVLEEKTKGNLETAEQNFLTQTLYQLRMAFVELSKKTPTTEKK